MNSNRLQLSLYKQQYKKVSLILRKSLRTKGACEDAGYLMYYPSILDTIESCKDSKRILRKQIRYLSKLIKYPKLVEYENE